jgi:hypothetical protein
MSLSDWRRWLHPVAPARRRPRPAAGRGPLRLEALEHRCVPAVLTVTNNSGSAAVPGSLPALVANSAPNDTIQFAPGLEGAGISLTSTLDINKNLTIDATGTPNIVVSGMRAVQVFRIEAGAAVNIFNLTITNGVANAGNGNRGGGIENLGTLFLVDCTVSESSAGISGGGIFNSGLLTLRFDTFNNNSSNNTGGAISNNSNTGRVEITNCTIALNVANLGGAITNIQGVLNITNSTIARNTVTGSGADDGGIDSVLPAGFALLNTIVFNPNSGAATNNDVGGIITQAQECLFSGPVTIAAGGDLGGNQQGVDPLLGPLQNNGGPTATMALQPGSPAIGTGASTSQITGLPVPFVDERGYLRQPNSVDIGAFQTQTGIVADFAGNGVQEFTPGGWQVLTPFDAQAVAVDGAGDVVAAFAGAGLWRRTPDGTWTQIDTFTPQSFVLDSLGTITAAFSGGGLWQWTLGTWTQIDGFTPSSLAVDGLGDVVAAFAGGGLWRFTTAGVWTPIDGFTPQSIAANGQGVIVAAFAGGGVWLWTPNGVWTQIDGVTPQSVAMDAAGDVFASFAGGGLWRFTVLGGWVQIDGFTPQQFAVDADGQVVAAFGDNTVWRFLLGSGWTELNQGVQTVALGATQF